MKRVIILFTIFYIFLSVTNVNAAECTYSELKELKQLAQKVEIGYVPQVSEDGKNASFSLFVYNLDSRMKMSDPRGNYIIGDDSLKSKGKFVVLTSAGIAHKFIVYASSKTNCNGERLTSFSIDLPVYNDYYAREECKNNRDKNICKKWYDSSSISEEKFKELLKTKEEKKESLFSKIVAILIGAPLAIVLIVVYIGAVVAAIVIYNKRRVKIDI